jgi:phage portal protein BeeE
VFGDKADSVVAVQARNMARLDVANLTGVPAALLEGSVSTASLTYSTHEGQRNEFVDFALNPYIDAIASRLSQDDIVPRGQRVRFDLSDLYTTTPAPTGEPEED